MRLWLERSEQASWWGRRVYVLRAALVCDDDVLAAIGRHGIGGDIVYASPAYEALLEEAASHFDRAREVPLFTAGATGRSLQLNWRGLQAAKAADGELAITVDDLVSGTTIEADIVAELALVEAGLRAGFAALAEEIAALSRYATGEEELIELPPEDDHGTPAAGWVRLARRS